MIPTDLGSMRSDPRFIRWSPTASPAACPGEPRPPLSQPTAPAALPAAPKEGAGRRPSDATDVDRARARSPAGPRPCPSTPHGGTQCRASVRARPTVAPSAASRRPPLEDVANSGHTGLHDWLVLVFVSFVDEQLATKGSTFLIVFVVLFEDFRPLRPLFLLRTDPSLTNCWFNRKIVFAQGACWQLKKAQTFSVLPRWIPL